MISFGLDFDSFKVETENICRRAYKLLCVAEATLTVQNKSSVKTLSSEQAAQIVTTGARYMIGWSLALAQF